MGLPENPVSIGSRLPRNPVSFGSRLPGNPVSFGSRLPGNPVSFYQLAIHFSPNLPRLYLPPPHRKESEPLSNKGNFWSVMFYTDNMTHISPIIVRILLRQKRRVFLSNSPCFFIILWTLISFLIICFREQVVGNFKSSCRDLSISEVQP